MRRLLLGVAVVLLLGCQESPTRPPANAPSELSAFQLKAQGDGLAAVGDYEGAVAEYRAAVNLEPDEISFHFALGVALSHLNRREETAEQFRWVVTRGDPKLLEVRISRHWLVSAGELSAATRSAPSEPQEPEPGRAPADRALTGTVKGRIEWPGVDPEERVVPVDISIMGTDDSNRDVKVSRRFRLGRPYGFRDLPPGQYRLTAEASDAQLLLWDQKLTVQVAKDTVFDLTNANSPVRADQFPRAASGD